MILLKINECLYKEMCVTLRDLGFDKVTIAQYIQLRIEGKSINTKENRARLGKEQVAMLVYMDKIVKGEIDLNNNDEYAKHLKRMNKTGKMDVFSLPPSRIQRVPRVCVIKGIDDKVYKQLNSINFNKDKMFYEVISKSAKSLKVKTKNRIAIPYKYNMSIPCVLKIEGRNAETGETELIINKDYTIQCNRYIIIATFRKIEFSLGGFELVTGTGDKLYIYAVNAGDNTDKLKYYNARVYDYGYDGREIPKRLVRVVKWIMPKLDVSTAPKLIQPTDTFSLVKKSEDVKPASLD